VSATALGLVSERVLLWVDPWHVSSTVDVPVMAAIFVPAACVAVKSAVGKANAPVYTTTPLTTRKLLREPWNVSDAICDPPIVNGLFPELNDEVTTNSKLKTPLTYCFTRLPSYVVATWNHWLKAQSILPT